MSATSEVTTPPDHRPPATGLVVGALAGLLSGLFGVGGGIIIVPGLMTLAAMERRKAHGTSLAATLPIALASAVTFAASDKIDWPVVVALAVGSIAGAVLGTQLLQVIDKRALVIVFVVTILATAIRLLLADETTGRDDLTAGAFAALVVIGLLTGTLAGLLGIGGGVVMVPAMIVLFSIDPVVAKGTSVAVIVPTSIAGTIRNRKKANADLRLAVAVGGAGVLFAVVGSLISKSISDTLANTMFAGLLVVVATIQLRSLRSTSAESGDRR
ncbi:MAG: sulfite exporter TauE/SafE family protein [Actinomycetota bacterium]